MRHKTTDPDYRSMSLKELADELGMEIDARQGPGVVVLDLRFAETIEFALLRESAYQRTEPEGTGIG